MSKWKKSSDELNEKFLTTMQQFTEAEPRKMFGYHCSFLRGNMFTGLHEENWILRLPETEREQMIADHGAERFSPMGRLMKEYLLLPKSILEQDDLLTSWIRKSLDYASTLPVKKPKKRKISV